MKNKDLGGGGGGGAGGPVGRPPKAGINLGGSEGIPTKKILKIKVQMEFFRTFRGNSP